MRALVSSLIVLAGCVEDVPIAAECPPGQRGPCLVELDGGQVEPSPPDDPAPSARVDAGAPLDTSSIRTDASSGATYPLPLIENASFEFATDFSVAGDVTAVGSLTTSINPWYTCQPIGGQTGNSVTAVRAETSLTAGSTEGEPKVDVAPKDGDTFVTVGYLVNVVPLPLMQRLDTPLQQGKTYAFAIDALATSSAAMLSLEVRANEQGCLSLGTQPVLYKTKPITSLTWSTVCVRFTPSADLSYLILAAEPNFPDSQISPAEMFIEGDILGGPRLVFDNIRQATPEECPEL
ncbi:MAG TPA: hypothetical protein VFX59_12960 [Polyangiales bacterium]|nr:hypothetical protein [Polyangiales bacterium]